MAKTKKKKNYRLRKSVRRTLGALFMISAIIVAAIPFPDAAATDGTTPQADGGSNVTIAYGVTDNDVNGVANNIQLINLQSDGSNEQTSYTLVKNKNTGAYSYEWQFKYFVSSDAGGGAIITEYNDAYTEKNITLPEYVNTQQYIHVTDADFTSYFNNTAVKYTLTYEDWESTALNDIKDIVSYYYKDKYTSYEQACQKYKSDYEKDPTTAVKSPETTLSVSLSQIPSETLKKEYYCQFGFIDAGTYLKSFNKEKYKLEGVRKPRENVTDDIVADIIYVVKLRNPADTPDWPDFFDDTEGFLYDARVLSYPIKGIGQNKDGKGAFENVKTYMTLVLPYNLNYIADNAFKGSAVGEITIGNVQVIGHRAFKSSGLTKINWEQPPQTTIIGAEAFYGTKITDVKIPSTITKIGAGAFAHNENLTTLSFESSIEEIVIDKYAFFQCINLGSLDLSDEKISSIGEGAFAVTQTPKGNFTSFKFPTRIDSAADLAPMILAGRSNLQTVRMPEELGRTQKETLPANIFYGCSMLECVEFPDNNIDQSGLVEFSTDTFSSVKNPKFYVTGPKYAAGIGGTIASPRKSTWSCRRIDGTAIPYMYVENNKSYYEVCQGDYLLSIDDTGILQTCNYIVDGEIKDDAAGNLDRLIIPGTVGELPIKGIAEGCFTDTFLSKIQGPLVIEDGGALNEIANNVFEGAAFTHAYIGDSVEKIGASAFKDCGSLNQVILGKNIKDIGDSAFAGCNILTQVYFQEPGSTATLSNIGNNAFSTGDSAEKLEIIGTISPEYLPYAWAMDTGNYVNAREGIRVCYKSPAPTAENVLADNYKVFTGETYDATKLKAIPTNLTVILDNTNNLPTLVDYQHYSDISQEIRTAYETNDSENINAAERELCESALNVIVPEGVKSIDAKKYFDSIESGDNAENWYAYFADEIGLYSKYGLFAGYYGDATADADGKREYEVTAVDKNGELEEVESKGNDRIQSIILSSVEYLPDDVFDNCENLQTVQIGDDITDIGSIPFSDCTSLSSITFENDKFECTNGIIYENSDDNTKTIIECLAGRGRMVGTSNVDLNNDPNLATTTKIEPLAFSECPYITTFDLTGVSTIDAIPEKCFEDSSSLFRVDLPQSVQIIEDRAFATDSKHIEIIVRGREVGLGKEVCGNSEELKNTSAYLNSYKGTAVRSAAQKQGITLLEPPLGEAFTFKFYDETGLILIKVDYVEEGGNAEEPEESEIPVIPGKKFVGWNKSLKNITADDFALAVYESDGTGSGDGTGGDGTGGNGSGGTGSGGTGTGGNNVNGGIDTDGDGIPDVDADGNKLYKLTVTNGEGSGYYPAGKTVTIKAGNAPGGTTFAYWSCSNQDLIFEDKTDWITTLTMIPSDVTVICNFTGQYTLEVEYGSGSGSYPAGAKVAISAVEAPQGRRFASWVTKTSGLNIENSRKESTVITMPASNAKVTATYMDTGSISGNSTSSSKNNTSVIITKPGISDKDTASAYVSGSSDNFIVKISESLEAADEVQKALQKKYPDMSRIKYFAMDISLYDAKGINKITDTDGLKVNITMPIPDALREYAGNNRVGAVVNGELETLNPKFTTIDGVPSITFTATHFSPYTIYVDTGNMTVTNTLDSTPKTGDGIHPKWFLSIGLACISIILFTKRDRRYTTKAYR